MKEVTENTNMKIWNHASKTPTTAVKTSKIDGRNVSSINTLWPIQKATELWGPMGSGWGADVLEERYDEGIPIMHRINDQDAELCKSKTHTVKILFWYMFNDKKCEIQQYGHTKYVYKSKYGASEDPEAPKKSFSDAIKKALSFLGFSADIFMGEYDDREYVEQLKIEESIDSAEKREEEIEKKKAELIDYVTSHVDIIKSSKSENEIKGIFKTTIRHLNRMKNIAVLSNIAERGIKTINEEVEKRKNQTKDAKPLR